MCLHFVPEIAAPEESVPNLDVFFGQVFLGCVNIIVDADPIELVSSDNQRFCSSSRPNRFRSTQSRCLARFEHQDFRQ